jgi:DNA-binding MarR family transcriptional regulator
MAHREKLLLDLFTEIAIVEHLVRNHMATLPTKDLTAAQFGLLNYFNRVQVERERKSHLAWCFQVPVEEMDQVIASLEARGFLGRIGDGDDQIIGITAAGHAARTDAVQMMAPEIEPLMSEFSDEELGETVRVLQETRRVFDNLPERLAS